LRNFGQNFEQNVRFDRWCVSLQFKLLDFLHTVAESIGPANGSSRLGFSAGQVADVVKNSGHHLSDTGK
jgi:hypothetical protein